MESCVALKVTLGSCTVDIRALKQQHLSLTCSSPIPHPPPFLLAEEKNNRIDAVGKGTRRMYAAMAAALSSMALVLSSVSVTVSAVQCASLITFSFTVTLTRPSAKVLCARKTEDLALSTSSDTVRLAHPLNGWCEMCHLPLFPSPFNALSLFFPLFSFLQF